MQTTSPADFPPTAMPADTATAVAPADSGVRRSLLGQALFDTFGQAGARAGLAWVAVIAFLGVAAPFVANSHPVLYKLKGGGLTSPMLRFLTPVDVILLVLAVAAAIVLARRPGAGLAAALATWPAAAVGLVVAVVWAVPNVAWMTISRPDELAGRAIFDGGTPRLWFFVVLLHAAVAAGLLTAVWLLARGTVAMVAAARRDRRGGLLAVAVSAAVLSVAAAYLVSPPAKIVYEEYREAEAAGQVELAVRTIIPYSPNDRLRDRSDADLVPPGWAHWFGTTQYREDVLSRMIHACRVALSIGLIATGISTVIGVFVGGLLGYFAGRLDMLGMRLVEILEAVPTLLVLLIITVSFGRSLYLMMVAIGLLTWTSDARFVRAEFFKLRKLDFVQAAVAAGLGKRAIIFRHMLPNGIAPVLVNASFGIAGAILLESTLSFLGMGLGSNDPSWGQLLEQAAKGGSFRWWIATFPGMAIFLTVFSYVLIGEAVRDALDPKLKKAH